MKTGLMKKLAAASAAVCTLALTVSTVYAVDIPDADSPAADTSAHLNLIDDGNGHTGYVIFTDENGETYTLPDGVEVQLRNLTEADQGELPDITAMLYRAEEEVRSVNLLDELTGDVDVVLDGYNTEHIELDDIAVADLVCVDIFDISLVKKTSEGDDDYVIAGYNIPENVTATFELTFPFEVPDFHELLHEPSEYEWQAETKIERVDSDTLRITVDSFSPFALVVSGNTDNSGSGDSDNTGGDTDNTGNDGQSGGSKEDNSSNPDTGAIALGVSVGAFALLGAGMILTKNKNDKEK